ncbi:MAG: phytanoyl-CoA dioxygenase family protein [Candidatus Latescibacteria bacterium]|jgi:hypothetical protein|nr:phytanoyl-CoA dioxygenase family protein [Candidatus Latescibacterota bacterium]
MAGKTLNLDQLEEEGYTIVPDFLKQETTRRIREHMDSLLPPIVKPDKPPGKWTVNLRHPIPGVIMADILANDHLIDLARQSLSARELKLLEQVLIRSDPRPPPYGALGWHVDFAFFPRQYEAVPRQTYFHMVHCLNTVPRGGAAFMIVPGSHHRTYGASLKMDTVYELAALRGNPVEVADVDVSKGIEICPNEGDLLIFNPMTLHSASGNATDKPRYAYFASFFDVSATELSQSLNDTGYHKGFPDSMRDHLSAKYLPLLDW